MRNRCECARCGRQFDVPPENMPMGTLGHSCYGRLPSEPAASEKEDLAALEDLIHAAQAQIKKLRATIGG